MMESREVLPDPLGPISASSSPGRQQPVTEWRICSADETRLCQTAGLVPTHGGVNEVPVTDFISPIGEAL